MDKWIRRGTVTIVAIAVLLVAALFVGVHLGDRKAARRIDLAVSAVPIPTDAASIARGRYLYASRGCTDCHGVDGAGKGFAGEPDGSFYAKAPNISPGAGSVTVSYRAEDWVRTIRHGVKPSGRPLFIMPSEDYNRFTDADLGALVAYLKQMPGAAGEGALFRIPPPLKAMYGVGLVKDSAEKIDHSLAPQQPVAEDGSARHGAYVANMCMGCHGEHMSGGKIPGTPPEWPAAANLTPGEGSAMPRYADSRSFIAMLRTGKRPDGSAVSQVMPFGSLRELSDADAAALFAHLKTLPPVAAGNR